MIEKRKIRFHSTPYLTIFLSFTIVILIGTVLLWLPISTKNGEGLDFVDALFMSASSTCVTGLSVVANPGETFSVFGKVVIALLIEIGGLSFLTIALFLAVLFGLKVGIGNRLLLKEALNQNTTTGIVKLVKNIVSLAVVIQLIGSVVNTIILFASGYDTFFNCLGVGIFHSISSFNNAGLDIFGTDSSMIPFNTNVWLNISTMLLIILGGIGFIVIYDIIKKRKWKKFTLHTKIVLPMTLFLTVIATLLYKIFQPDMTWLQALFQSVTTRTAGFASYNMSDLSSSSEMLTIILMFIGASPCSTGGGIKTTTIFVIFVTLIYYSRGKDPKVFSRRISDTSVFKAFSLVAVAVIYIAIVITIMALANPTLELSDLVFETVSAFGTVGLSTGITSSLSKFSEIILSITMLFGRLGPLTIISMWNNNWMREKDSNIQYVEEKFIIG